MTAKSDARKILLFKTGAIGDVLMTTPLIRQLRKNNQKARIDFLVGNAAAPVLEGNKNIDHIIRFDPSIFFRKNIIGIMKLAKKIRPMGYDTVIVLDKHWIFNYTAKLFHIQNRIGFDRLGKEGKFLTAKAHYGNSKHEIYYYLDLLSCLGIRPDYKDNRMDLFIDAQSEKFAARRWKQYHLNGKKIISIAPGGGNNPGEATGVRNWPAEKYSLLILELTKKGYYVILIGSKQDMMVEKHIMNHLKSNIGSKNQLTMKSHIISLIGNASIKESAAIIRKCDAFICNDSGPMHIAAAVNNKIISIFGPTDPKRKSPLSKESKALWKDKNLYEPDYELYGRQPGKKKRFMEKITVDDVLKELMVMKR